MVFAVFMLSLTAEFWQIFLTQAVGMGLAMGLTFVPAVSRKHQLIAEPFAKTRPSLRSACWPTIS